MGVRWCWSLTKPIPSRRELSEPCTPEPCQSLDRSTTAPDAPGGSPSALAPFSAPPLRPFTPRTVTRVTLAPLSYGESLAYIRHRLQQAGAGDGTVFTPGAVQHVARHAHGNPRVMNVLCTHMLLTGFAIGQKPIAAPIAKDVLRAYSTKRSFPRWWWHDSRRQRPRRRGYSEPVPSHLPDGDGTLVPAVLHRSRESPGRRWRGGQPSILPDRSRPPLCPRCRLYQRRQKLPPLLRRPRRDLRCPCRVPPSLRPPPSRRPPRRLLRLPYPGRGAAFQHCPWSPSAIRS